MLRWLSNSNTFFLQRKATLHKVSRYYVKSSQQQPDGPQKIQMESACSCNNQVQKCVEMQTILIKVPICNVLPPPPQDGGKYRQRFSAYDPF